MAEYVALRGTHAAHLMSWIPADRFRSLVADGVPALPRWWLPVSREKGIRSMQAALRATQLLYRFFLFEITELDPMLQYSKGIVHDSGFWVNCSEGSVGRSRFSSLLPIRPASVSTAPSQLTEDGDAQTRLSLDVRLVLPFLNCRKGGRQRPRMELTHREQGPKTPSPMLFNAGALLHATFDILRQKLTGVNEVQDEGARTGWKPES
ncbi:hypothetical protein BU23DRAFT_569705 [Bimuria novae-zelandiae CBS 107.79]|uniref:Uncharacterized protein n=1 Tax=Bimuria novae-zelandiae CBS 107.79 TaxID=1447943 RepID=A0A6A5V3D2_9PLEO|nr:hypothetical protein BU23DRAFT_569705 [Bimuria novae-zelandiae CBS 107.79]